MRTSTILSTLAVAAPAVLAQEMNSTSMGNSSSMSNETSLCDKYTTALLMENNSTNQYTLLTLLVNTAVIGNYTTDPAPKNAVTGILNNGTYEGRNVSLLKYFDGMLASTNRGGAEGVSVNFLDDGGAVPLTMNMPANGTSSNQYFLLTHLYQYFGVLLGCSTYGEEGFPRYGGSGSQYQVHKFMDLSFDEVSYFIQEVGLAAASFGVSEEDIQTVATALGETFNYRCLPPAAVVPEQGERLQSICIGDQCPLAENAVCAQYQSNLTSPVTRNDTNQYTSTSMMPTGTSGAGGSGGDAEPTESGSSDDSDSGASANILGAAFMGVAGLAALAAGL